MSLLRFQPVIPNTKKGDAKPKKENKEPLAVEKVDLNDIWEKANDDKLLVNQLDPTFLMKSADERKMIEYDMIIV
jgi:hypothetical protein